MLSCKSGSTRVQCIFGKQSRYIVEFPRVSRSFKNMHYGMCSAAVWVT